MLLPTLMIIYPDKPHKIIVAITMTVIMVNASFGVFAYSRLGRIDYKAGIVFSLSAIPFAILGSYLTPYIPGTIFKVVLGVILALGAFLMIFGKNISQKKPRVKKDSVFNFEGCYETAKEKVCWNYDARKGFAISGLAGFIASLMGIGGGVFHVPAW